MQVITRLQVGLDEAAALERLTGAIPAMLRWMRTFVADRPQPGSLVDMGAGGTGPGAQCMCIQVSPPWFPREHGAANHQCIPWFSWKQHPHSNQCCS